MQNLGTCGVKQPQRLTEEDLLTSHDIIKLGEPGQLAKLQMLSETRRSTVPFLSLSECRSVNRV